MTHHRGTQRFLRFLLAGFLSCPGEVRSSSSRTLQVTAKAAFHGQTQRLEAAGHRGKHMAKLSNPLLCLGWAR